MNKKEIERLIKQHNAKNLKGSVYIISPLKENHYVKFACSSYPEDALATFQEGSREELSIRHVAWFSDMRLAMKVRGQVRELIPQSLSLWHDWFQIPVKMAVSTIQVAADKLRIPIIKTT